MKLIKVTKVAALDGFKLDLEFNDGTHGVADLTNDLTGPLVALRDPKVWKDADAGQDRAGRRRRTEPPALT